MCRRAGSNLKAMNPNAVIELRDVAIFHFDDAPAGGQFQGNGRTSDMVLSDVNLTVFPGELVYLIGRVGSGKSSLLKTLYAELPLREGGGMVVGFDLRRMRRKDVPYLRRRIGIVFQDYQLLTDRNVFSEPAFRAEGDRVEKRIADPQQDRRSARHGKPGKTRSIRCRSSCRAANSSGWRSPGPC